MFGTLSCNQDVIFEPNQTKPNTATLDAVCVCDADQYIHGLVDALMLVLVGLFTVMSWATEDYGTLFRLCLSFFLVLLPSHIVEQASPVALCPRFFALCSIQDFVTHSCCTSLRRCMSVSGPWPGSEPVHRPSHLAMPLVADRRGIVRPNCYRAQHCNGAVACLLLGWQAQGPALSCMVRMALFPTLSSCLSVLRERYHIPDKDIAVP